jgi:hypothetical protein
VREVVQRHEEVAVVAIAVGIEVSEPGEDRLVEVVAVDVGHRDAGGQRGAVERARRGAHEAAGDHAERAIRGVEDVVARDAGRRRVRLLPVLVDHGDHLVGRIVIEVARRERDAHLAARERLRQRHAGRVRDQHAVHVAHEDQARAALEAQRDDELRAPVAVEVTALDRDRARRLAAELDRHRRYRREAGALVVVALELPRPASVSAIGSPDGASIRSAAGPQADSASASASASAACIQERGALEWFVTDIVSPPSAPPRKPPPDPVPKSHLREIATRDRSSRPDRAPELGGRYLPAGRPRPSAGGRPRAPRFRCRWEVAGDHEPAAFMALGHEARATAGSQSASSSASVAADSTRVVQVSSCSTEAVAT